MNFDDLLKQSQEMNLDDMVKEMEEAAAGNYNDGYWKPKLDKAGNGTFEFRFLPPPTGEKSAAVLYYSHFFKGKNGKTYSERSLTTFGEDDPVGKENGRLWNTGYESDKDIARSRKRKKNYVSNILILKDSGDPDNEGKIFKYSYGAKIYKMIQTAMKPEFEEDEKINPFDLMATGANFRLKAKKQGQYNNYDDSKFGPRGALFGGDIEKMRKVFDGQTMASLAEEINPNGSAYKSYDKLKKRMDEVLADDADYISSAETTPVKTVDEITAGAGSPNRKSERPKVDEDETPPFDTEDSKTDAVEDDDDVAFFRKLAGS